MPTRSAPAGPRLDTPVKFLKGIGERRAEALERLGIRTARDLLWHLPHRYVDASTVTPLAKAELGREVACVGRVVAKGVLPTRRGLRIFHVVLRDESGVLECVWPGQAFLDRTITVGQTLLVSGPVRFYHGRQMVPREYVILADADSEVEPLTSGKVLPVYPATEGLSHKVIRSLIDRHLDGLIRLSHDGLPEALRTSLGLPGLAEALRAVHRPATADEAEWGRRRLAFDELFDLQLMLIRARAVAKRHRSGVAFTIRRELTTRLKQHLPWELTDDQQRAIREITGDMTAPERMHRLLMGDVGTGKTVVALFAMLLAVENDFQAALMAPTELLAEQHAATLEALLAPLDLRPELLLGRHTAAEKSAIRRRLASGQARLAVGTHALLQESVSFRRLGLVVIDEQHRFGVEQRAALIGKGSRTGRSAVDGDAHSALAGAHALRRSRRLDLEAAAARAGHRAHRGAQQLTAGTGLRLHTGRVRPGKAGVHRAAGHRGIRESGPARRDDDGANAGGALARAGGGPGSRPAQGGGT